MKHKLLLRVLSLLLLFCFAQCKKQHDTPKTEIEKLPAITQEGKNTFGCLLNGTAYTPGGGGILDNVLSVQYDPSFQGGKLSITMRRIYDSNMELYLSIGGDSINNVGIYQLSFPGKYKVFYEDSRSNCTFTTIDPPGPMIFSGSLNITKFDTITKIISGIFSFKISNLGCGILEATDGRFDVKY